jgi:hypothetical protein
MLMFGTLPNSLGYQTPPILPVRWVGDHLVKQVQCAPFHSTLSDKLEELMKRSTTSMCSFD